MLIRVCLWHTDYNDDYDLIINQKGLTPSIFQRLKSQSNKFRSEKTYSSKTAEKQDNIKKNRYKDIVPCKFHSEQI